MNESLKINKKKLEYNPVQTNFIDPPIICILGERGDGKTLVMVSLAYLYLNVDNLKIFANFHLKEIPFKYTTFKEVSTFPTWLKDGVILLDEAHTGADAYEFFKRETKAITKFITQLRKRNLTMLISTQRFMSLAKRLRNMTNYVIEVNKTEKTGIIHCLVFDQQKPEEEGFIKDFLIDGRQFFNMYDTNEIIDSGY